MVAWLLLRVTAPVRTNLRSLRLSLSTWLSRSPSTLTTVLLWSLLEILVAMAALTASWLVFASPWAMRIWWGLRPWTLR
jgi:hypothetical protein